MPVLDPIKGAKASTLPRNLDAYHTLVPIHDVSQGRSILPSSSFSFFRLRVRLGLLKRLVDAESPDQSSSQVSGDKSYFTTSEDFLLFSALFWRKNMPSP